MASRNSSKDNRSDRVTQLHDGMQGVIPQTVSWWDSYDSFDRLYIKAKEDGTVLAIAKGVGSDGGPVVCFGSGLSVAAALIGLEGAMAANKWRPDKPWRPEEV